MEKRRAAALLLALAALMTFVFAAAACKPEVTDELVVYNWADYIYDYEDDFREYYRNLTGRNITVTYVTFDTNETMLTKILKGDSTVDVMCPSEYAIQKLCESDLLIPMYYFDEERYIDAESLNGYAHNGDMVDSAIVEKVRHSFEGLKAGETEVDITDYFVPYMYGTLGILYNKEYFEQLNITDEMMTEAGWGILFNDNGKGEPLSADLDNRILMKDSIRDSYAATIFYLRERGMLDGKRNSDGALYTDLPIGELINTVDDTVIELASQVLLQQKKFLYGYEVDFGKNDLIQGNAYVDLAWSGDALYAVEESWDDDYGEDGGYTLGYFVPQNAGNIWFDGWVIPKTCKNMEQAKIFINFLNSPYVAAQNMLEIGYSSALSKEAVKNDDDAMAALMEGYNVYAPEIWTPTDDDGREIPLSEWEFDFADIDEFSEYFFDDLRYPEVSADMFGVMKDFGENNSKVVAMWEEVRSSGISAWALLGWTALAVAAAAGIIALARYVGSRRKMYVKVGEANVE